MRHSKVIDVLNINEKFLFKWNWKCLSWSRALFFHVPFRFFLLIPKNKKLSIHFLNSSNSFARCKIVLFFHIFSILNNLFLPFIKNCIAVWWYDCSVHEKKEHGKSLLLNSYIEFTTSTARCVEYFLNFFLLLSLNFVVSRGGLINFWHDRTMFSSVLKRVSFFMFEDRNSCFCRIEKLWILFKISSMWMRGICLWWTWNNQIYFGDHEIDLSL